MLRLQLCVVVVVFVAMLLLLRCNDHLLYLILQFKLQFRRREGRRGVQKDKLGSIKEAKSA